MSDQRDLPPSHRPPAPELISIAKAIARGLAQADYEEFSEQRRLAEVDQNARQTSGQG